MTDEQVQQWAREVGCTAMEARAWSGTLQAFAVRVRNATLNEVENLCVEMETHYHDYAATALLNGDVDLSNAASGEPRACRFIAERVRGMK